METDGDNFLSILSKRADLEQILSSDDVRGIQMKLWELLGKRVESYTMGDSSSVRIETAEKLLKSACFIVGLILDRADDSETIKKRLVGEDFDVLFKAGLKEVQSRVEIGKGLYIKAVESSMKIENYSYKNTVREIELFFKLYDIYNFAHEIPCMIDYPLAQTVNETLLGIDYINEYLRRLIIENAFCSRFDTETVIALLKSSGPDYTNNHLNIYEAVAGNAFAFTLLKGDIYSLDITDSDREKLRQLFSSWQENETISRFQAASSALCSSLDITDTAAVDYVTNTITALVPRLQQSMKTKGLDALFPSLYREHEDKKPAVSYVDGPLMDNETLRKLIDEISSCRYVSDKIELVKQNVRSLRDYVEILNICFWDEECLVLFDSLSKEELKHLRLALKQKQSKFPEWTSETGWENYLIDYAKGK